MHVLSHRWLSLLFFCLLLGAGRSVASDFDQAVALFQAKHFPDARAAFEKLAASEPSNAAVHYYLGRIAFDRDDADNAIDELEQATAGAPKNSDYALWLGSAYGVYARQHSSISKACKCRDAFLRAVELNPDNIEARAALATFYRMSPWFIGGSMDKAHAQADEIKKRDPLRGAQIEGEICIAEKKYDDAFNAFESLLKDHPDQIAALYQIGYIAATTGQRLDRGEAALKEYLTHTPKDTQPSLAYAHYRLGNIYQKKDETDAARKEYQAALALDPHLKPAADALDDLK
ncbi:MAG TPA: tetratricopeptide repeat protein [Opitutaceae bacterium]|nr:tetratricopeptide repeat protein [Opitutaceae bacterium]